MESVKGDVSIFQKMLCNVMGSKQAAASIPGSLRVRAWDYGTGDYRNPPNIARWATDYRTCAKAYELAGLGPDDLDLVECHDAFTIGEILHYEALGLCEPGEKDPRHPIRSHKNVATLRRLQ